MTGHSAQGKTLPTVLTNLNEGGFAAYVAASHARSRHGLYITKPINLEDLNKPLPYNLLQETDRLQDLEHNTYVCYGFSHASYQNIRNPVSKRHIIQPSLTAKFDANTTSSLSDNSIKTPLSSFTLHPPKHENPNLPTSSPHLVNPTNIKRQKKYIQQLKKK